MRGFFISPRKFSEAFGPRSFSHANPLCVRIASMGICARHGAEMECTNQQHKEVEGKLPLLPFLLVEMIFSSVADLSHQSILPFLSLSVPKYKFNS